MKIRTVLSITLCALLFVGCSGKKEGAMSIYKDLDAKKTYEKLVEKMNGEVEYVKFDRSNDQVSYKDELYKIDDSISLVRKTQVKESGKEAIQYSITSKNKQYILNKQEVGKEFSLETLDNELDDMYVLFDVYKDQGLNILGIGRKDNDDKIVLEIKWKSDVYVLSTLTIGKDGLLESQVYQYYTDDTFDGEVVYKEKVKVYDYNQKKSSDFDKEIKVIKSLDGATEKEVKEKIGL